MIDDITVAGRVPFDITPDRLRGWDLMPSKGGKPAEYGRAMRGGILYVKVTPALRVASLRISVPRWLGSGDGFVNYPLQPLRSVQDLRPGELAKALSEAFNLNKLPSGVDHLDLWPVARWVATRVAFAIDIPVSDKVVVLTGFEAMPRRRGVEKLIYKKGAIMQGVVWQTKTQSLKLYDKSAEILARIPSHRSRKASLESLAKSAENILRFEVSFLRVKAIRAWWSGLGIASGYLPSLTAMADVLTYKWALMREAKRMGLFDANEPLQEGSMAQRVPDLMSRLNAAVGKVASGELSLKNRKTLTEEHKLHLFNTYVLLSAVSVKKAMEFRGCSESSIRKYLEDLNLLGLTPDGSHQGSLSAAREVLSAALKPFAMPDNIGWEDLRHHFDEVLPDGITEVPWHVAEKEDDTHRLVSVDMFPAEFSEQGSVDGHDDPGEDYDDDDDGYENHWSPEPEDHLL